MRIVCFLIGLGLIVIVLSDAFETILQPRRVIHRFRFSRLFYRYIWTLWRTTACSISRGKVRQAFLSTFGPFSLLGLFIVWVTCLIIGFGILHWSLQTTVRAPEQYDTIWTYIYLSGTTFFTLGYGDVTPVTSMGRTLAVVESGLGFGFLAVIISYLPVLYQAFSHREVTISLMDARAGSPPSASEVLRRAGNSGDFKIIDSLLKEWETWAAELLESHLSFPVISYYRSQHDNQSWLGALTCMLDSSAAIIALISNHNSYQAQLTFAMCRHAAVDLTLILKSNPIDSPQPRLSDEDFQRMIATLRQANLQLDDSKEAQTKLAELRYMYEPFVNALAKRLMLSIPQIIPPQIVADNWQRSPTQPRTPGIGGLPAAHFKKDDHFA